MSLVRSIVVAVSVFSSVPAFALPPPANCPSDLSLDMKSRTIDTRTHKAGQTKEDYAVYKKMKWAPNHTRPVGDAFVSAAAVDDVLRIEARTPTLLPAGFRAAIAASPRDPDLRLRIAACELGQASTRRRASYDAALALLLGAPMDKVKPILLEATRNEGANNNTFKSCWQGRCENNETCLDDNCVSPMGLGVLFISKDELDIEDALTRGLMKGYRERNGEAYAQRDPVYWWMSRRLHHCGGQTCTFAGYSSKLAEWDVRDGGSVAGWLTAGQARALNQDRKQRACESCNHDYRSCLRGDSMYLPPGNRSCLDQYEVCLDIHGYKKSECH
jgi:hypothetical protein